MDRTLSILDANDLITVEKVQHFAMNRELKELESFTEGMRQAMTDDARLRKPIKVTLDQANYLPSSSLRGDSGCVNWKCRLPKIRRLARYVALYCDTAVIPVRFPSVEEKCDHSAEVLNRLHILSVVLGLMELRPVLESGMAVLVPEDIHLCREHWHEAVPQYDDIMAAARSLANKNAKKFSVTYYPQTLNKPANFEYTGPEEYLEHGTIRTLLDTVPEWLHETASHRPVKLSQQTIRSRGLVLRIFLRMANDALLQEYFGAAFDARYATDAVAEAEFFQTVYESDELAMRTAALCAHLSHTIPLMSDVPIRTIIKIRRSEPEAFENYKSTLTKIIKEYSTGDRPVTSKEAGQIYLDLLKPQLDQLAVQAENIRRDQLKRGLLKVAAASVVVGLGLYSGILPSQLADLCKTIGGFSVAKDLAETFGAIERNPKEIRNHNLYFLLRLKQRSEPSVS